MDSFITIFLIGGIILFIVLFIGILKLNNSLPNDHTRMKPIPRSIGQTLLVVLVLAILVFSFFF